MPKKKNPAAALLGRLSGLSRRGQKGAELPGITKNQIKQASAAFSKMGGKERAKKLSVAVRKSIATKAARARWSRELNA